METYLFDIGLYTSIEASRLLKTSSNSVSRWIGGYNRRDTAGEIHFVPPLWTPDIQKSDSNQVQLSFRDLMETRFVKAFRDVGLSLQQVRKLYSRAQDIIENERPFSTAKFYTDGKRIFFEQIALEEKAGNILDLSNYQHVFKKCIQPTFKDIEYSEGAPILWHPHKQTKSIVLDPKRSFGQPILKESCIPTATIQMVYNGYQSYEDVAREYEISVQDVKDAIAFESHLTGT